MANKRSELAVVDVKGGGGAKPHSEPGRGCQVKRAGVPPSLICPFTFEKIIY